MRRIQPLAFQRLSCSDIENMGPQAEKSSAALCDLLRARALQGAMETSLLSQSLCGGSLLRYMEAARQGIRKPGVLTPRANDLMTYFLHVILKGCLNYSSVAGDETP